MLAALRALLAFCRDSKELLVELMACFLQTPITRRQVRGAWGDRRGGWAGARSHGGVRGSLFPEAGGSFGLWLPGVGMRSTG